MKKSTEKKTLLHRIVSASAAFIAAFAVCTMSMSGAAAAEGSALSLPEIFVGGKYKVYAAAAEAIQPSEPQTKTVGEQTYYLIGTREELLWFANRVNKDKQTNINAVLTSDVSFNDTSDCSEWTELNSPTHMWTAIGTKANPYRGIFDGDGFAISGIYISNDNESQGLFGYVADGTIKDLGITQSYIKGGTAVGGIVGTIETGRVKNCYNSGTVNGRYCGGVVGAVLDVCAVSDSYNLGNVVGTNYTGGVFGYITAGCQISNNYNAGSVHGINYVGGIAGHAGTKDGTLRINNCFSRGELTATGNYVGGLVGVTEAESSGASIKISNCYSYSEVASVGSEIGGFVGYSINSGSILIEHSRYYINKNADMFGAATGTSPSSSDCAKFSNTSSAKSDLANFLNDGGASRIGYRGWVIGEDGMPRFSDEVTSPVWDGSANTEPALVDGYYLISNGEELAWFAAEVKSGRVDINGKLTADIVLNYTDNLVRWPDVKEPLNRWTPIGDYDSKFSGIFDGDGHVVAGIYINGGTIWSCMGLFGYIDGGTIKNVGVVQGYINAGRGNYIGGVVGCAYSRSEINPSTIINCYNSLSIYKGGYGTGGVVGEIDGYGILNNCYNVGEIFSELGGAGGVVGRIDNAKNVYLSNCYNTEAVTAYESCGGIAGYCFGNISVSDCYNTGKVFATATYAGGLIGSRDRFYHDIIDIKNCYNSGSVSAPECAGGLIGFVRGYNYTKYSSTVIADGLMCNSYNAGAVSGTSNIGGLIGKISINGIDSVNCYNIGTVSGTSNVGALIGCDAAYESSGNKHGITTVITNCKYSDVSGLAMVGMTDTSNGYTGAIITDSGTFADKTELLRALNSKAKDNEDYKAWECKTSENNGYPVFAASRSILANCKYVQNTPSSSEIETIKNKATVKITSINVNALSGYEFSRDKKNWSSSISLSKIKANTNYTFYVRKAETSDKYASAYVEFTLKTKQKQTQEAPTSSEISTIRSKIEYNYGAISFTIPMISYGKDSNDEDVYYRYSLDATGTYTKTLYGAGSNGDSFTIYVRKEEADDKYESTYSTFTIQVIDFDPSSIGDIYIDTSIYDFANTYFGF